MNRYTIGVTGATGKIGSRLVRLGCVPLECDVTDLSSIDSAVEKVKPDIVCHLASLSDVDFCELPENKEKVIKVNLRGTYNVALSAETHHHGMVMLSSDHVFDGKHGPYKETDKPKNPVNFYGMTKMAAESLVDVFPNMKIVRTSYLFNESRVSKAFYSQPADGTLEFPIFLRRSFMYEGHFAKNLHIYLQHFFEMPKILHISGRDTVSWYEFALAIASVYGFDKSKLVPRKKEWNMKVDAAFAAPRPKKAGLIVKQSSKFLYPFSYIEGLKEIKEARG